MRHVFARGGDRLLLAQLPDDLGIDVARLTTVGRVASLGEGAVGHHDGIGRADCVERACRVLVQGAPD